MLTLIEKFVLNNPHLKFLVINERDEVLLISESAKRYFAIKGEVNSLNQLGVSFDLNSTKKANHHQAINKNNEVLLFKYTVQKDGDEYAINIEDSSIFKHLDDRLKERAEEAFFLQKLIDQTAIVSITDSKGNILSVNKKFTEVTKYSYEELIGQNQNIVNSGHHPKSFWTEMWSVIGKGGIWKGDIKNKAKDGSIYWVETTIMPKMVDGKPEQYISIRQEITDKKLAIKENLRNAMFYKEAALLSNLGCWEIDLERNLPIWDDQVKRIHEVPMDYQANMEEAVNFYPPEVRDELNQTISEAIEQGENWEITLPFITAKGNHRWVKSIGKAEKKVNQVERVYGVFQDVTDKIKAEEDKFEKELAQQEAELKDQFLSNMSHEIRTPMNGVIGIVDLLKETKLDTEQKNLVDIIASSGDNLLNIVNDILDLNKLKAGKFTLHEKAYSLEGVLNQVKHVFLKSVDEKGLSLNIEIADNLADYYIFDETRVFQIISNITSNAIKYTKKGGINISASIGEKGHIVIEIQDTGIGIPEDMIGQVFRSFEQVQGDHQKSIKGTGLGLSITKRLAKLMKGDVSLKSEIGKGSTFTVVLPLKEGKAPKEEVKDIIKIESGQHVLVVEDNITNQKIMSLMLSKLGMSFDIANGGQEALDIFDESRHQKIFMDIRMPGIDGNEATKILRERGVKTPIIGLSGNAMQEDFDTFKEKGFTEYLTKPLKFDVLKKIFKSTD